jgi:hypothetical protein
MRNVPVGVLHHSAGLRRSASRAPVRVPAGMSAGPQHLVTGHIRLGSDPGVSQNVRLARGGPRVVRAAPTSTVVRGLRSNECLVHNASAIGRR